MNEAVEVLGPPMAIVAVVTMIRIAIPSIPDRFWPLAALVLGMIYAFADAGGDDSITATVSLGISIAWAASGLFSWAKAQPEITAGLAKAAPPIARRLDAGPPPPDGPA